MSRKHVIGAFGAGMVCMGAMTFAVAMGPEEKTDPAAGMSPEAMEEMAAWMALGTPGEPHQHLARSVGEWDAEMSFQMDPSSPPVVSKGTMTTEAIYDGRYVVSDFHCPDMMGMPFSGRALMGYDNGRQKYVGTWIDSMSTAVFVTSGKMEDGKLVLYGENIGPDGELIQNKMVTEWHGEDKIVDTFHDKTDGEWVKTGTITYTRKGHAHGG